MNTQIFLKHCKLVLWGVAVVFVAQILFTGTAHADDHQITNEEFETRLEALSTLLVEVSGAIAEATSITPTERLTLFTQLVDVSRAILALESAFLNQRVAASQAASTGAGSAPSNTLDDLGLHRITLHIDVEEETAEIVEYYLDEDDDPINEPLEVDYDTTERTPELDPLPEGVDWTFAEQVDYYKSQVVGELAELHDVDQVILGGITFVSARDPRRDNPANISLNSADAYALAGGFGDYSIITEIVIKPGRDYAQIDILSDQDEMVRLAMLHQGGAEYVSTYEYYTTNNSSVGDGEAMNLELLVRETTDSLTKEEAVENIQDMFAEIPFVATLREADERLFSFLLENPATYQIDSVEYDSTQGERFPCIDRSDEVVMNEYSLQLLAGMRAQYILKDGLLQYDTTLDILDNIDTPTCRSVQEYF